MDMDIDYKEIGKRIAHRRKELGLRQSQLSEMVGISDPYMSNIERATSIPSTEVILRLAIALKTTPDEFLVGSVHHRDQPQQDILDLLSSLSDQQLGMAKSFLLWLRDHPPE